MSTYENQSFNELLERPELVYHGIGADFVALDGIAKYGILSANAQLEQTGTINSKSPRDLAFNGDDRISVALRPTAGKPNDAFFEYIETKPIAFSIDSTIASVEQPYIRGLFDEAFTSKVPLAAINGVVLDEKTARKPLAENPILGQLTAVERARIFGQHLINSLGVKPDFLPELDTLLVSISHLDDSYFAQRFGGIDKIDEEKINEIDVFLQYQLGIGLQNRFGDRDISIEDVVKILFPDQNTFINDHTHGIKYFSTTDYFDTLDLEQKISWQQWDGEIGEVHISKFRRLLDAAHKEQSP